MPGLLGSARFEKPRGLMTGKKPNRGMVSMIGFHLLGLATDQDVLDYLNLPDNTGVKNRIKEALWKNLGY